MKTVRITLVTLPFATNDYYGLQTVSNCLSRPSVGSGYAVRLATFSAVCLPDRTDRV